MSSTGGGTRPPAEPAIRVSMPRAQQRLWLAGELTADRTAYLGCFFLRLSGALDVDALGRALTETITRHQVLRTSICEQDGEIIGLLHSPAEFSLPVEPVDADRLEATIGAEAATPLVAVNGLPLRARLLRLTPIDHVLCLTVHHFAFDRGSAAILFHELGRQYAEQAGVGGEPAGGQPVRQYREIAAKEESLEDAGDLAWLVAERRSVLDGLSPFELPPDLPRPAVRSGQGTLRRGFELPAHTVQQLTELGRARSASLYMTLLAGCQVLLYRYTGRSDVTTGMSSTTRHDAESAAVIGPFFNMLALPGDVSANPSFSDLVARVREAALDAYDSRRLAFDTLLNEMRLERDPARTPLFQILIDFTTPIRLPQLPGIEVSELLTPGSGSKYDLTIEFHTEGDGIGYLVEWDTALYETETVLRLMRHLQTVLVAVAENPSLRVDDVPMLSPQEIAELCAPVAADALSASGGCLHERFSEQAARTPDGVAVIDGERSLSYAELDRRSDAVAHSLLARGIAPESTVGLLLERSAELVVALLGVLKAGAAYLPIDPELPAARIRMSLAGARAVLCLLPGVDESTQLDLTLARQAATEAGCPALDLMTLLAEGQRAPASALPAVHPDQLCAVYFTSGSTGTPKGVACTHRGWVGQMLDMQQQYRLGAGETVLLKTPLSFDDVAREIFWPLMIGARLAVLGPGLHRDARALLAATAQHRVVWLQFVPSMLALWLEEITPGQCAGLSSLRHVVSDGDRLRPETVQAFLDRLGQFGCRLHNQWGTTEVSIDSTHHLCVRADADADAEAVVLGLPMSDHQVYILDSSLQPVPRGAVGELCLGGGGLARGYLGEPGRTARAFVPNPWRPGERLYRTGDTGRLRPDGSLQYRGRRDHQVKIRGVRIELGEVEAVLRACPGVVDAVVASWQPTRGDSRLAAYVVPADPDLADAAPTRSEIRDFLNARLPLAAVPAAITLLPRLPRLPSGKIDRRALPQPDLQAQSDEPFVAPESDVERALAAIWTSVLGVAQLGANDDFFGSGGHSLLVSRAVNRMRDAFAIDVPMRLIFEHSTLRGAAAQVEELIIADLEAMTDDEAEQLAAIQAR